MLPRVDSNVPRLSGMTVADQLAIKAPLMGPRTSKTRTGTPAVQVYSGCRSPRFSPLHHVLFGEPSGIVSSDLINADGLAGSSDLPEVAFVF